MARINILTSYLFWWVLDLLCQFLIADDLGQYFLKGVRLTEELIHVPLGLPRHQHRVTMIVFKTRPGLDILSWDQLAHLLLLCLNDRWLDDGVELFFIVGTCLQSHVRVLKKWQILHAAWAVEYSQCSKVTCSCDFNWKGALLHVEYVLHYLMFLSEK